MSGEMAGSEPTDAPKGGLELKGFDMPERSAKESISCGSLRLRLWWRIVCGDESRSVSSPGELFFPKGEDVPILITFGLEDSSSSGIPLTLDDLPRRTILGLEDDVRLELGPEEVKVPVLGSVGT